MPPRSPSPSPSLTQPTVGRHPLRHTTHRHWYSSIVRSVSSHPSKILYAYHRAVTGFSARLTAAQAAFPIPWPPLLVPTLATAAAYVISKNGECNTGSETPEAACMLRALPGLPEDLVLEMMEPPRRSYDPLLIQDPAIYSIPTISLSPKQSPKLRNCVLRASLTVRNQNTALSWNTGLQSNSLDEQFALNATARKCVATTGTAVS
ncbi:hypothetical protein RJ639_003205 [Escallonia herrerae]|uniref:Inhibitor I9 domain-containing protein n=1 Tax=Escallonia herrerae TaxID=1293975 RepID=A0AA89AUX4_9ASTE|nr:hypothetical protein RJ639_003205 [Escallonia herrerae]